MNIYCDGFGNNRSVSGYCVIRGDYVEREIYEKRHSNDEMKWKAMIHALRIAETGDTIYTSSLLVFNEFKGTWKIMEPTLEALASEAMTIWKAKKKVKIRWIPREQTDARIDMTRNY